MNERIQAWAWYWNRVGENMPKDGALVWVWGPQMNLKYGCQLWPPLSRGHRWPVLAEVEYVYVRGPEGIALGPVCWSSIQDTDRDGDKIPIGGVTHWSAVPEPPLPES
jgi:hypothetical protein